MKKRINNLPKHIKNIYGKLKDDHLKPIFISLLKSRDNFQYTFDTKDLLEAIKRAYPDLRDSSIEEIGRYIDSLDETQLKGFINNLKGVYHEIKFVEYENKDKDNVFAKLFTKTNHPGSDVILYNTKTGKVEYLQLKATDDINYIKEAMEKYPDIRIASTKEVAEKLHIDTTGMSNEEITKTVKREIERIRDYGDKDLTDYIPKGLFWYTLFQIYPLILDYKNKRISFEELKSSLKTILGYRLTNFLIFSILLSIPFVSNVTMLFLIYTLLKEGYDVFKN